MQSSISVAYLYCKQCEYRGVISWEILSAQAPPTLNALSHHFRLVDDHSRSKPRIVCETCGHEAAMLLAQAGTSPYGSADAHPHR